MCRCAAGQIGCVELLLRAGSTFSLENDFGETAADLATAAGHQEAFVRMLRSE